MNSCVAVRAGDNNAEDTPKTDESGKPKDTAKEGNEPATCQDLSPLPKDCSCLCDFTGKKPSCLCRDQSPLTCTASEPASDPNIVCQYTGITCKSKPQCPTQELVGKCVKVCGGCLQEDVKWKNCNKSLGWKLHFKSVETNTPLCESPCSVSEVTETKKEGPQAAKPDDSDCMCFRCVW